MGGYIGIGIIDGEAVQSMSPQNKPFWHIDYFDLETHKKQQV